MKRLWYKMDITTRLAIACIGLYMSLYLLIDIIEVIFDVTI
jgi:hypothetical protein